jgi:hypothetical protein
MENKLPIYYATINEDLSGLELKEQGIQNIALVDSPAMLQEWIAFSEQKPYEFKFAIQEEQRIITAPVIVADLPIYRKVDDKEFYVVYKKETNMQILQKYMLDGNQRKVKLTHDTTDLSKGVFVFEVFISDASRGIKQPEAFDLPDGTIFCSMKIHNDNIWKKVKSGEVKGVSLEGFFDLEQEIELSETEIEAIIKNIL